MSFGGTNTGQPAPATSGFSFGSNTPTPKKGTAFGQAATSAAAAPNAAPFGSFGQQTPSSGGFSFGAPPAGQTSSVFGGFGAASAAPAASSGLPFGAPAASQASQAPAASSAPAFSGFGAATAAPAGGGFGGFALAKPTAPTAPAATAAASTAAPATAAGIGGFNFQGGTTAAPLSGFSGFGTAAATAPAATSAAAPTFSGFGLKTSVAPTVAPSTAGPSLLATPKTTAAFTGFGSMAPAASTTTTSSGATPVLSSLLGGAELAPKLPAASSAAVPAVVAAAPAAASIPQKAPALSLLGTPSTSTTAATGIAPSVGIASLPGPTGFSGPGVQPLQAIQQPSQVSLAGTQQQQTQQQQMTYARLEELINEWSHSLDEQERTFLTEATKVNAWDRALVENGDRITRMHEQLQAHKRDQTKLAQELDVIEGQQAELEQALEPLLQAVDNAPIVHQHADKERENIFNLTQNVSTELNQMQQDIKEVIDHVNRLNSAEDAGMMAGGGSTRDSFAQVTKIMNVHTESLQWIDEKARQLSQQVLEMDSELGQQIRRNAVHEY